MPHPSGRGGVFLWWGVVVSLLCWLTSYLTGYTKRAADIQLSNKPVDPLIVIFSQYTSMKCIFDSVAV
jgi:hypothetical protein